MVRSTLLVLMLLMGLVSAGCGRAREVKPDASMLLDRAATRMEQVHKFHYKLEHEHGATTILLGIQMTRAEGAVAGPDTMRANVNGTLGNANLNLGMVVIGQRTWVQNPLTRRWEETPFEVGDLINPQAGLVTMVRAARDARVVDSEDLKDELDGIRAWKVEATIDSQALSFVPGDRAPGRKLEAVAWIGVKEPLVYRVELRGPATDTEPADIMRRLSFTKFDADVTIEPPR